MNFLRLSDILLTVLFENDDIIAIDKPYGFNAHTNDSKIEHSDFIQDGLIEIFEKQIEKKLHVIHRLDQTTTGVMIFGKSTESAKKYAEFFFNRQVKKTYLFITKSVSKNSSFLIDQEIIHKGKNLDAKTNLSILKKSKSFELWQANPHTGRNHQVRIHAKAAEISILGDSKYEGHSYPFLCLHNHKIEFPNSITITSKPPVYFDDLTILEDTQLAKMCFEADRRLRLFQNLADSNPCYRLIHNKNNAKDAGFFLDVFGPSMVLSWFKESWTESDFNRFTFLAKLMNKNITVRFSNKSQLNILANHLLQSAKWTTTENEANFEIRTDSGNSVGLFLNQRLQRNWVFKNAVNKTVLNLFSHTGTFSLMAAHGKATTVTSVETNKAALNWSKQNFELNHLSLDKYTFLCRDSLSYIESASIKKQKFDLIICDAPSFIRCEKGVFKIENNLEDLIKNCLMCLNPNGHLLFSTTFDDFYIGSVQKIILKVQSLLKIQLEINCILPSLDFELPDEKANLKSFLIKLC